MTRALVRVDAGPGVGLGHLERGRSLAAALARVGIASCFVTPPERVAQARVESSGFAWMPLNGSRPWSRDEGRWIAALAKAQESRLVIVDAYAADEAYLAGLRDEGLFVAAIDDLGERRFPCQLVINGGAHAGTLAYRSTGATRFLLGPEYALLRPEFWDAAPIQARELASRVLVTVGGSDASGLLARLVAWLEALPGLIEITAVQGPFASHPIEPDRGVRGRVVQAPASMAGLMREADLAVCGGGQTMAELAVMGVPTVAIEMAENQAPGIAALAERGAVAPAGRAVDASLRGRVTELVGGLLHDAPRRAAMGRAGRAVFDGRGALRVAEVMAAV